MSRLDKKVFVVLVSLLTSALSVIHVVVRHAFTPKGYLDLATGHYHVDYFTYLKWIAKGIRGQIATGSISIDEKVISLHQWPHILLGYVGGFFGLSPWVIYWLAVFGLCFVFLLLIYYAIDTLARNKPFYIKMSIFLVTLFTSPFYKIQHVGNEWQLLPFDYWYGPGVFARRFEVIPYHLLGNILVLVVLLLTSRYIERIQKSSIKKTFITSLVISFLLLILLTFSPFSLITLVTVFMGTIIYYLFDTNRIRISFFLFLNMALIVPCMFLIKNLYSSIYLFNNVSEFEMQLYEKVKYIFMALNIGPIVLFVPFGIWKFFKNRSPIAVMLFLYLLCSYAFFISPLALNLGTHNLRFLSAINYIPLSVLCVYGLSVLSRLFKLPEKKFVLFVVSILLLYFSIFNVKIIYRRALNKDPSLPLTKVSHLPQGVIDGFSFLQTQNKEKIILTYPNEFFGQVVPIFLSNKVFIGEPLSTKDYWKKATFSYNFYYGLLQPDEAQKFVYDNHIKYIFLTTVDNVPISNLKKYPFLKIIFSNKDIAIFEVK